MKTEEEEEEEEEKPGVFSPCFLPRNGAPFFASFPCSFSRFHWRL